MTETRVHVRLSGETYSLEPFTTTDVAGVESSTFIYDVEYLVRPDAYALDPELPLTGGFLHTQARRALFGCFTDCAPDRWGRTLLARREAALAREEGRAGSALTSRICLRLMSRLGEVRTACRFLS